MNRFKKELEQKYFNAEFPYKKKDGTTILKLQLYANCKAYCELFEETILKRNHSTKLEICIFENRLRLQKYNEKIKNQKSKHNKNVGYVLMEEYKLLLKTKFRKYEKSICQVHY